MTGPEHHGRGGLDRDTADAVFTAALHARFRTTNLGRMAEVSVGSYSYRVIIAPRERACTDCRSGWGGTEFTFANATPEQDRALREAARTQPAVPPPHRHITPSSSQRPARGIR